MSLAGENVSETTTLDLSGAGAGVQGTAVGQAGRVCQGCSSLGHLTMLSRPGGPSTLGCPMVRQACHAKGHVMWMNSIDCQPYDADLLNSAQLSCCTSLGPFIYVCCRSPGIPGIGAGPLLFVTRHTGQEHAKGGLLSRVSIYSATSGACIKEIVCSHFKQANMMALA